MGKSSNHYFKVKPGDDARLFDDVDIETEGFIARLRRKAHDCTPYGFLVDSNRKRIYDAKKIADIARLGNQRTGILIVEAHGARLLLTASEFRIDLALAASKSKKAKLKLEVFDEMCRELPPGVGLGDVMLLPTLVEDHVAFEAHRRFGKAGGSPVLLQFKAEREAAELEAAEDARCAEDNAEVNPTEDNGEVNHRDKAQKSDVKGQRSKSKAIVTPPSRERESSTAHARGDQDEKSRMTVRSYTARAHEIQVWQTHRKPTSEETFLADFEAAFEMPYSLWCSIRRDMERSIEDSTPQTCRDGHHVFDGDYCTYCPFIRVGESA